MTTPKEALEYGLEAVRESFASAKTRDEQLLAEARYSAIESALASLQGEDAVERVARLIFFAANDGIEYDTPTNDSLWYAWKDDPSSVEYRQAARAILATGLVPDEAAVRADEREKCAKVAVARSDAVMAEAEAAHDDDNYDLYERLECEAGNYMDLAAAIRSGGTNER